MAVREELLVEVRAAHLVSSEVIIEELERRRKIHLENLAAFDFSPHFRAEILTLVMHSPLLPRHTPWTSCHALFLETCWQSKTSYTLKHTDTKYHMHCAYI